MKAQAGLRIQAPTTAARPHPATHAHPARTLSLPGGHRVPPARRVQGARAGRVRAGKAGTVEPVVDHVIQGVHRGVAGERRENANQDNPESGKAAVPQERGNARGGDVQDDVRQPGKGYEERQPARDGHPSLTATPMSRYFDSTYPSRSRNRWAARAERKSAPSNLSSRGCLMILPKNALA